MDEKKAKKLYNKMLSEGMLPELFKGSWAKDKSAFLTMVNMDEKLNITYDEYVDSDSLFLDDYGDSF